MTSQIPTTMPVAPTFGWPTGPKPKWEREYQAFLRLRPQLLETNRGQYVAIHDEQVIDVDNNETVLIARVLARIGNVDIHVGRVTDVAEALCRSGVVRDLSAAEAP